VMEAELAALQKQNEQLKSQLYHAHGSASGAGGGSAPPSLVSAPAADANGKLDSAVKHLAGLGFTLNSSANFSNGTRMDSTHTNNNGRINKTKTKKTKSRKVERMEMGGSSPSSSSSDDESPSSSAPTTPKSSLRSVTGQELNHAIAHVSHCIEEAHAGAETQLNALQHMMDSAPVRAVNLLSTQLAMATKEPGNLNAMNVQVADQAVMAMHTAHAQFMAAMREYTAVTKRSFAHLSGTLAPEQLARCFQGIPLQY